MKTVVKLKKKKKTNEIILFIDIIDTLLFNPLKHYLIATITSIELLLSENKNYTFMKINNFITCSNNSSYG